MIALILFLYNLFLGSLDGLVDEYKQCDKMSEETLQQEGPSDTDSLNF
jgi:hypothetical protein